MRAPWQSAAIRVFDESGVGTARRAARAAARELGLSDLLAEQTAIVATEAGRNALLHAGGGEVVVTAAEGGGVDVLALDRGPGIADLARAMRDGYSTAGTPGQGLGAISRIATLLDVYSAPGHGTALLARVGAPRRTGALDAGAVCVAVAGEAECGDGWALELPGGRPAALVADGLGHGPLAAEAARAAVTAFRQHASRGAAEIVERLHAALRATRGAAVAVAEVTGEGGALRYAGIGNISGVVAGSPRTRKMVSLPGTAGHEARTIRSFDYDWPDEALLVLHSDGIASHWDLDRYPGLALHHPALVAGVLYRDFARGRDDATVLALRRRTP